MIAKKHWTRRDFLRAAGISTSAALLAPLIPQLSTEAFAQQGTAGAKRFLFLSTGNGTVLPQWRSNGQGTPFSHNQAIPELMGPILAALNPWRSKMIMLDGIDMMSGYENDGRGRRIGNTGHGSPAVLWTGRVVGSGQYPDTASLDWRLNQHLGTGKKSLHIGTYDNNQGVESMSQVYSYDDSGTPIYTEFDPPSAFDYVFGPNFQGGDVTPQESSEKLSRRLLTLDLLRGEIGRLKTQLPTVDRERLDAHLDKMVNLEERVRASSQPIVCDTDGSDRPEEPSRRYFRNNPNATIETYADIIGQGFACDQIRVAQWSMTSETSMKVSPGMIPEFDNTTIADPKLHDVTHMTDGTSSTSDEARRLVEGYSRWCAERVATVLTTLESHGVLEDTIVIWGMGQSHAGVHSSRNAPQIVFQGSNNGPFDAGKYLRYGQYTGDDGICDFGDECHEYAGGESNNNFLISVAHAAGLDITEIGNPEHCNPNGLDDDLLA